MTSTPSTPTRAELRAQMARQFAAEIKAEVDRAVRECPLIEGSDAALKLRALVGNDLIDIIRACQTARPDAA